jgi:PAS domain S-box-containing protein
MQQTIQLVGYIAILLVYVILNTLILSVYFALKQRTSITNTVIELTQQAVTTYLITLIIAILVSFLLVSSHIIGVLLFTAVALLISFSYRSYFKIFDELRGMKQTYQSLFDYNPDLVFIFNLNGQLSKANENFTKVTGYEESYFKTNLFSTIIVPQYIATAITTFEKVTSGNPQNELIEIFHKNGNILKMEVTIVPLVVEKEIKGVIGYAKDVTKMKETEDLLRRSEKLSVVGELAAGVAHEIRNPLTTIRGFLQFEKNSLKDSSYQDIMIAEIDRINFIVSEFLSLAKPQKLVFEKRSIHSIVKEITTLSKSEANLNSVAIEFTSEDNLPPINCEKNQLKQVFINILKNGIEAMPNGGKITISISSNSDYVIVRFVDEGIGIPKERIDRIGEPFFTLKEKGMGLGMTMSYKIMEEHNGDIKINSEVGVGTTVEVLLPIA